MSETEYIKIRKSILFKFLSIIITPCIILFITEFGSRLLVALIKRADNISDYRSWYYPEDLENASLIGHPFSQIIGNYKSHTITRREKMNSLGFTDDEFDFKKKNNIYRIATLGGSTTQGYEAWPNQLEKILNMCSTGGRHYEVMNFGLGGYITTHSLINTAIHVVDYQVDLIIIHDSYNDTIAPRYKVFRNDYAHYYKPFKVDVLRGNNPIHLWLVKNSVFYTACDWFITAKIRKKSGPKYSIIYYPKASRETYSENELMKKEHYDSETAGRYVFLRNLKTIKAIADAYDIHLMILTGPFLKVSNYEDFVFSLYNDYLREFARRNPDVLFFDLAEHTSKIAPFFVDGYHVNLSGQVKKAQLIKEYLCSKMLECE